MTNFYGSLTGFGSAGVAAAVPIAATGGSIATVGDYKVHTFTSSGTFEITAGTGSVEYLIIAGGGGGGGAHYGGGAGAGGHRSGTESDKGVNTYTVTIGGGGTGGVGIGKAVSPDPLPTKLCPD